MGEEFTFDLERGKTLIIKLVAVGPLVEEVGRRDVFFLLNGEARVLSIEQLAVPGGAQGGGAGGAAAKGSAPGAVREKGMPDDPTHVCAPMGGVVVEVRVAAGAAVQPGDPIAVLSAMKMETVVNAACAGVVERVCVRANASINAGDLIAVVAKGAPAAAPAAAVSSS